MNMNPFGPVQVNIAPGVEEFPCNKITGLPQVSVPPAADTLGRSAIWLTEAVAVAEQPVALSVTVTVYVPGAVTVAVALLPRLFDQAKVPPPEA